MVLSQLLHHVHVNYRRDRGRNVKQGGREGERERRKEGRETYIVYMYICMKTKAYYTCAYM